jgi:hypothetical protein
LKLTAKKPPEEDSGNQSGECSQPFTLPTPDWKLAIHALFQSRFPHAGRWLKPNSNRTDATSTMRLGRGITSLISGSPYPVLHHPLRLLARRTLVRAGSKSAD